MDKGSVRVSAEALERMKAELEELKTTGREEMGQRLAVARAHGDLRENAEYDAAKNAQGLMEARIRKLEQTIRDAVVMESPDSADAAAPGLIVVVKEEGEDEPEPYYLAASAEDKVDGARTVTTSSPLGKALVGRKPGETTQVEAPGGTFAVEIVEIRSR